MDDLQENNFWQDTNSREFFRLAYPAVDRPKLIVKEEEYEVLELAENSVSFISLNGNGVGKEQDVIAIIRFHDDDWVHIAGRVIRNDGKKVVMQFNGGVSFQRMIKEQHHLITKYRK